MKKDKYLRAGWKYKKDSACHKCICYFIGGGLLFLGVFVSIFGIPILLIEFLEKRLKKKKRLVGTMDKERMNEELRIQIEGKVLVKDFYMQDFASDKEAAKYLGISTRMWLALMREWDTTLLDFIYTMRFEDVKDYLEKKQTIRLGKSQKNMGLPDRSIYRAIS